MDSETSQPINDRIYISQENSRKIDHSEEAHDEGGGFTYVFHEKGGRRPDDEDKEKEKPVDIGEAVEVHISGKTIASSDNENTATNEDKEPPDEDKEPPKHINITV